MARYTIKHINKISSGPKRGLIDMVVGLDYLAQAPIVFLDATNQNGDEVSGVVTESNRDYSYVDTEYISDYKN